MAEVGRPSIFTAEIAQTICDRLADGESLRAICRTEGFPSDRAVRRWATDDPDGLNDPVARLKVQHLDERQALGEEHRAASAKLRLQQEQRRAKDRGISNGATPAPEWLIKERAARDELSRKLRHEAQALADRHRGQLATAVKQNPTK